MSNSKREQVLLDISEYGDFDFLLIRTLFIQLCMHTLSSTSWYHNVVYSIFTASRSHQLEISSRILSSSSLRNGTNRYSVPSKSFFLCTI